MPLYSEGVNTSLIKIVLNLNEVSILSEYLVGCHQNGDRDLGTGTWWRMFGDAGTHGDARTGTWECEHGDAGTRGRKKKLKLKNNNNKKKIMK